MLRQTNMLHWGRRHRGEQDDKELYKDGWTRINPWLLSPSQKAAIALRYHCVLVMQTDTGLAWLAVDTWYQFPVGELGKTPLLMQLWSGSSAFLSDGGAIAESHCECQCSLTFVHLLWKLKIIIKQSVAKYIHIHWELTILTMIINKQKVNVFLPPHLKRIIR